MIILRGYTSVTSLFLVLQRMRRVCPEWLEPPFSPFRKSNVDTAWPRLVRASILFCHTYTNFSLIRWSLTWILHTFLFVFINSKRAGSDSREKRDLQHDPQHWTLHSHSNRPQWVQTHSLLFFVSIYIQLSLFFLSVSPWLDNRGESRTPQRVSLQGIVFLIYTSIFYDDVAIFLLAVFRRLCCSASFVSVTSAFGLTEKEGSVCLHNTPQAQEEDDKWV